MQRFGSSSVSILEQENDSTDSAAQVMEESGSVDQQSAEMVPTPVKAKGASRLIALDLMRGFIMIIMSWYV